MGVDGQDTDLDASLSLYVSVYLNLCLCFTQGHTYRTASILHAYLPLSLFLSLAFAAVSVDLHLDQCIVLGSVGLNNTSDCMQRSCPSVHLIVCLSIFTLSLCFHASVPWMEIHGSILICRLSASVSPSVPRCISVLSRSAVGQLVGWPIGQSIIPSVSPSG